MRNVKKCKFHVSKKEYLWHNKQKLNKFFIFVKLNANNLFRIYFVLGVREGLSDKSEITDVLKIRKFRLV